MIDWYAFFFERSKTFYLCAFLLLIFALGLSSFSLYKHFDKAPALRQSILLYNALNSGDSQDIKKSLQDIIEEKCQPYANIAAMHLAQLKEDGLDNEKKRILYNFVVSHTTSSYIRELALLNLEVMNGEIKSRNVYISTSYFLDAFIQFVHGHSDNAEVALRNIDASVDANLYAKKLATSFLNSISYQSSLS